MKTKNTNYELRMNLVKIVKILFFLDNCTSQTVVFNPDTCSQTILRLFVYRPSFFLVVNIVALESFFNPFHFSNNVHFCDHSNENNRDLYARERAAKGGRCRPALIHVTMSRFSIYCGQLAKVFIVFKSCATDPPSIWWFGLFIDGIGRSDDLLRPTWAVKQTTNILS